MAQGTIGYRGWRVSHSADGYIALPPVGSPRAWEPIRGTILSDVTRRIDKIVKRTEVDDAVQGGPNQRLPPK